MVSKHDINTFCSILFIFIDYILPPLENYIQDINNGREEGEEVNSKYEKIREKLGLRDMEDKEDKEHS